MPARQLATSILTGDSSRPRANQAVLARRREGGMLSEAIARRSGSPPICLEGSFRKALAKPLLETEMGCLRV